MKMAGGHKGGREDFFSPMLTATPRRSSLPVVERCSTCGSGCELDFTASGCRFVVSTEVRFWIQFGQPVSYIIACLIGTISKSCKAIGSANSTLSFPQNVMISINTILVVCFTFS